MYLGSSHALQPNSPSPAPLTPAHKEQHLLQPLAVRSTCQHQQHHSSHGVCALNSTHSKAHLPSLAFGRCPRHRRQSCWAGLSAVVVVQQTSVADRGVRHLMICSSTSTPASRFSCTHPHCGPLYQPVPGPSHSHNPSCSHSHSRSTNRWNGWRLNPVSPGPISKVPSIPESVHWQQSWAS